MKLVQVPHIIDVEASGFGADSYPIEVGCILSNGQRYCSLITPLPHWTHWTDEAEQTHRIDRATLTEFGKPPALVCEELNEFLQGCTVYSDGWVVDKPWIERLFYDSHIAMRFFVSPIELLLQESQLERWHRCQDAILAESNMDRHRASSDAFVIQQTFIRSLDADTQIRRYG